VMGLILGTVITSADSWNHPVYYVGPGYHYGPVIYHNGPVIYHYGPYGWNHPVHPIIVPTHPQHYMSDRDIYNWDKAHPNNQVHPYQNQHPDQPIMAHPVTNINAKPADNNAIKTVHEPARVEPTPVVQHEQPIEHKEPVPQKRLETHPLEHPYQGVHRQSPAHHSGRPFR